MSDRELGLGLQSDKPLGDYGPLAAAAEAAGFATVCVFNDLWFQPPLPALLEIAAATSRVRLGPVGMNPFTVHPVEIAGQIAALDAASHGRAYLGLVRGRLARRAGCSQPRPVVALREAWEVVRRLLAGDLEGFAGERFSLPPGRELHYELVRAGRAVADRRLAAGPGRARGRARRTSSRSEAPRTPRWWPSRASGLPSERRVLGRRADDVGIVLGAVSVVDEDGAQARELARRKLLLYLPVVARLDPSAGVDAELVARLGGAVGLRPRLPMRRR